jgi:hypothetical protein
MYTTTSAKNRKLVFQEAEIDFMILGE